MSLLEPPEAPEHEPEEEEVTPAAIAPVATTTEPAHKDICKHCYRPIVEVKGSWRHWDPRIDMPQNAGFCIAELWIEPPTKWGFLQAKGKSDFSVGRAGGRGGGGVAA